MGIFKKSSKNKNEKSSSKVEEQTSAANIDPEFQVDDKIFFPLENNDSNEEEIVSTDSSELTEKQIQKQSEIESVKSKISKILKSSNIEIVDENFGDEYDLDETDAQKQSQQDYDTLKALFGDKDRNKKDELTLTIDDFDYTYVGKYIEEFDLMHLKNIKHIKLKNPNVKKIKKILIAASLVVVAAVGAVCGFMFTKTDPVVLSKIELSQKSAYSKHYEGDYFYFDGLKVVLTYSNGMKIEKPLEYKHFLYSAGGNVEKIDSKQTIQFLEGSDVMFTFNYEGHTLTYEVEVKEKILIGISAKCADGLYSLRTNNIISATDCLIVLFEYENYGISKDGNLSKVKIIVDGIECSSYNEEIGGWKLNKEVTKNSYIEVVYEDSQLENSFTYIV